MNSVIYETKPSARQLFLDTRTKIVLCLVTSFVMFSAGYSGIMSYMIPVLAIIPIVSLALLGKKGYALFYGSVYVGAWIVQEFIDSGNFTVEGKIIVAVVVSIFMQLIPGFAMFQFLIASTTVSEFIAAMEGFHIPKRIIISVSVMFRFFPAVREEYGQIRNAMRQRRIGTSLLHPLKFIEYQMVPLLSELMIIGNELGASAMTRGLDSPQRRTNMCRKGFHSQDYLVFTFCIFVVAAYVYTKLVRK